MFRRRRVQPTLDPYIARRYEDIAVSIYHDIKNGRGTYNYYAPWLEGMLERIPSSEYRDKHSLMRGRPLNAWQEEGESARELKSEAPLNPPGDDPEVVGGNEGGRGNAPRPSHPQQAWSQGLEEEAEQSKRASGSGRGGPVQNENVSAAHARSRLCTIL